MPKSSLQRLRFSSLVEALEKVGLKSGEIVHIQSSLPHLGPVEYGNCAKDILNFYLDGFRAVLGSSGTILVHTPFEDYGRYGTPFIVEESPSRAGVFSEFIRTRPGAVRSMHPIVSTAGLGPNAKAICEGAHFEGFGWESSWGRMHRADVRFVTLGIPLRSGLSFAHYVEAQYGVPYQYCKIYSAPVYKNRQQISGAFTMRVRYLDFSIAIDIIRYQQRLFDQKAAYEATCGRGIIHSVKASAAFDIGIQLLAEDVYAFLREPPKFRTGEIPFDGPTGGIPRYFYDRAKGIIPSTSTNFYQTASPINFDILSHQDS